MLRVLLVGYGRIGRTKSHIWRDLGGTVSVYDVNPRRRELAQRDGFGLVASERVTDPGIVLDISTPNGSHVGVLARALGSGAARPHMILIEKPVVSSSLEEQRLLTLAERRGLDLESVLVHGSYVVSRSLISLKEMMSQMPKPNRLDIELSKSRIEDEKAGRFIDRQLGAFGIELPHIMQILQVLGLDPNHSEIKYCEIAQTSGPGAHVASVSAGLIHGPTQVSIATFLDRNRKTHSGLWAPNSQHRRRVRVHWPGLTAQLDFDPVAGQPRFTSRLSLQSPRRAPARQTIADDHLRTFLTAVTSGSVPVHLRVHSNAMTGIYNGRFIRRLMGHANTGEGQFQLTS